MDHRQLIELLSSVKNGRCSVEDAADHLQRLPSEQIADACIDHQRTIRTGIPEVIYGESKTAEQISAIASAILASGAVLIATRIDADKAEHIQAAVPGLQYHAKARLLTGNSRKHCENECHGTIAVICAGTSDIPIAEEARITAMSLGHPVESAYDIGVAGLHRLLDNQEMLKRAAVVIVVAGMEGALPSVVGGLVSCPVIGVPTSIGYGTAFGGIAALLGMLNSCVPGLAVVNIDNGFGAGCLAASINRRSSKRR
jgi:pyridinium-3,5-biscarboxylic acid mononucleotide synthase